MKSLTTTAVALFSWRMLSSFARADVEVEAVAAADVDAFHFAVATHYEVEKRVIVRVVDDGIPDQDTPVVFFVAREARVPHHKVVALRVSGKSWFEIATHFGIAPRVFYVDVDTRHPPYGRAVGHYKHRKRATWNEIVLSDGDVTALVHLKFLSAHHGWAPQQIVDLHVKQGIHKLRKHPMAFVKFHSDYKKHGVKLKSPIKTMPGHKTKVKSNKPRKSTPFKHEGSSRKSKGRGSGGGKGKGKSKSK